MPKKILEGTIISNKMPKTVVVKVGTPKVHPKHKKRFTGFKKYKADTANNVFEIGDRVLIEESRPISKDKKWIVKNKV
ncbi:MAG: 30S ribosomal protein S17 [Candidatus Pacebacteria bacterium]|nr:30S ribosomal protein S17 [Candidatus Paceibacterota bacterium]